MLSKLLKYDIKSMLVKCLPLYLILLLGAVSFIFVLQLPQTHGISIFANIFEIFLIIIFISTFLVSAFIGVYRFYTNTFGYQGYLTNTLPVKKSTILLSNIISSCIIMLITLLVSSILIYYVLSTAYSIKNELELLNSIRSFTINVQVLFLQSIIFATLFTSVNLLCFFTGLTLGHAKNDHKLLYSFVYTTIIYIITLIGLTLLALFFSQTQLFDISDISTKDINVLIINYLLGFINLTILIYSIILFIITNYNLNNKLNLQ